MSGRRKANSEQMDRKKCNKCLKLLANSYNCESCEFPFHRGCLEQHKSGRGCRMADINEETNGLAEASSIRESIQESAEDVNDVTILYGMYNQIKIQNEKLLLEIETLKEQNKIIMETLVSLNLKASGPVRFETVQSNVSDVATSKDCSTDVQTNVNDLVGMDSEIVAVSYGNDKSGNAPAGRATSANAILEERRMSAGTPTADVQAPVTNQTKDKVPARIPIPPEWKQVVRKRSNNKNSRAVVGDLEAENAQIRAMDKKAHLHLLHMHPDTTEESVAGHLQSLNLSDCMVFKIKSRSPNSYSSFRITMPFDMLNKVNSPSIWPKGAKIQRYRFFHRPASREPTT